MSHTPGPWTVLEHSWCETSIAAPSTTHAICTLDINHTTEELQEADEAQMAANARLIAAAPDLLECLKDVSAYYIGEHSYDHPSTVRILGAIAKAEGK